MVQGLGFRVPGPEGLRITPYSLALHPDGDQDQVWGLGVEVWGLGVWKWGGLECGVWG